MLLSNLNKNNNLKFTLPKAIQVLCVPCRNISSKIVENDKNQNNFTPVYNFKYIKTVGFLNIFKIYQTAATCILVPASIGLNFAGIIDSEILSATCAVGISGSIFLNSLGFLTNKLIGIIYINEKRNKVKVSYCDFWGKRKDEICEINDIVPFSDIPKSIMDQFYFKFSRYSTKNYLKLNTSFGNIMDTESYQKMFLIDK